jgi:hypothetical protein
MLYARAFLLRNCGRFTHVSSDFGSQYHTHTFVTSEALYAGLTRGVAWRHQGKFVDLDEDARKSAAEDYFFCDYDVTKRPLWFTPGVFIERDSFALLPKRRGAVDKNDFNVVDEDYPSTGGTRFDGKVRRYFCPTYGKIEGVLPDHRMLALALSPSEAALQDFSANQTFLLGKKRTMFQLLELSDIGSLASAPASVNLHDCFPVQVNTQTLGKFSQFQVIAGTARYLLVRGQTSDGLWQTTPNLPTLGGRIAIYLPNVWIEKVRSLLNSD